MSEPLAYSSGRRRPQGENWGSKVGVILAVAGSAVGLGNFLRFPGLAAKYGGGTFMIPYFISLLIIGIPICWCEWTLGRQGGKHGYHSSPGILRVVSGFRGGHFLGVIGLLIPLVIYMYYVYIESWCLAYAWFYASGRLGGGEVESYSGFFGNFVGVGEDGLSGDDGKYIAITFLVIAFVINFVLIYRGLTKGIETFCKLAMPLLILAAIVVLIRVLTLGTPDPNHPERNLNAALGFMWNPNVPMTYEWKQDGATTPDLLGDQKHRTNPEIIVPQVASETGFVFEVKVIGGEMEQLETLTIKTAPAGIQAKGLHVYEAGAKIGLGEVMELDRRLDEIGMRDQPIWVVLKNPKIWLEASGQIFFSLSVGFGIIITYASYLRPKDDIALSGLTASATNEFCEVCLGGLITVPAAFLFLGAHPIQESAGSTLSLGFMTFPGIFDHMSYGRAWGCLWFLLLFLAAITSSLSMLQPAIAFIEEALGVGRRVSVTLLMLVTAIGGLIVVYFSKGLTALDTMDFWVGQVLIFIMATIIVIIFGWSVGVRRGLAEANRGGHLRIPDRFFGFVIKFVSPIYLLAIFAMFLGENVVDYVKTISNNRAAVTTLAFIGVLIVFLSILVFQAGKKWDREDGAHTETWEI